MQLQRMHTMSALRTLAVGCVKVRHADKDETALAVLARVAGVSDKSTRGDFVN